MKTYIFIFIGASVASVLMTALVVRIAVRRGLIDSPGVRKVHKSPVPRIGGVAIFLAATGLILSVMLLDNTIGEAFRRIWVQMLALLGASTLIFAVGFIDDVRSLPSRIKLLSLIVASLAMCASGSRIEEINVAGLFSLDLGWVSWPCTVLWIVCVSVGMNFIDGLDGLAAGIAMIVCGIIAMTAFHSRQIAMVVLMMAVIGSLSGFLVFNFNPARIFMGDCGSMFLGFVIGAGSIVCAAKTSTMVGLAMPMLALGVPIVDTILTIIRRGTLDRRSIFSAERGHIHHRLIDKGLSHRRAVLVIYGTTLVAAGTGMFLMVTQSIGSLVVVLGVTGFLLFVFHWAGSMRIRETLNALQRNAIIRHGAKLDRVHFEHAQLAMREASSVDECWDIVRNLAQAMAFEQVCLVLNGSRRVWRRTPGKLSPFGMTSVKVPLGRINGTESYLDVVIKEPDTYETMGRHLMLFGRLIDEWRSRGSLVSAPVQTCSVNLPVVKSAHRKLREPLVIGSLTKFSA